MTQTIINVPAAGAFDPTDIVITDNTSGAFLIKDDAGSPHEYMRIDTTTGSKETTFTVDYDAAGSNLWKVGTNRTANSGDMLVVNSRNTGLGFIEGVFLAGPPTSQVWVSGPSVFRLQGCSFAHNMTGSQSATTYLGTAADWIVTRGSPSEEMIKFEHDSNMTFTLDDASGAVFKVVDDAASPRTYFTATENGTVHVDGVKIGRGGGAIVDNVAIGDGAFNATQTGFGNSVAVGYDAGNKQTSAYNSTFVGFRAGKAVTTGLNNTALGSDSIDGSNGTLSCTGSGNTGVGRAAVRFCTTGSDNSGFGHEALENVSSGSDNVGLGALAGDSITTGSGNIAIGHDSDCAAAGVNQIAIGNGVVETTNNRASIGDSSNVATLDFSSSGNSWSTTSDVRIKENIQDSDLGLAFINSLRPVKHTSKDPTQWPEEIRMADPSGRTPEQLEAVKDGLIAQEVKAAAEALGTSFSGWEQDANGLNRLQYERFVVPLIKAVQELSAQVEELKGDK